MAKYKTVPWKRNIKKIPGNILNQIRLLDTDIFVVACVKTLTHGDQESIYSHLNAPGEFEEPSRILPPTEMGVYSTRNVEGWEIKRSDLPKVSKSFFWESPNFGDSSRYGTHLHFHSREVYQREFQEPRYYGIVTTLLKRQSDGKAGVYQIKVDQPIDRSSESAMDELLFTLNLLQENCGSVGIFKAEASRDDYLRTITLDWEVFPPGTTEEIIRIFSKDGHKEAGRSGVVEERVKLFSKLKPTAYLRGSGGLSKYMGAKYANDLVVFENMDYGNALYVLYENWEEISKRSRLDLLRGTDAGFDRIPHTFGWEVAFGRIMKREKRSRGIV